MDSKNENNVEHIDAVQKIGELEALLSLKDKTINELKESEVKLKTENQAIKEQTEKFKRVASNMFKELSALKFRKWQSESESYGK